MGTRWTGKGVLEKAILHLHGIVRLHDRNCGIKVVAENVVLLGKSAERLNVVKKRWT